MKLNLLHKSVLAGCLVVMSGYSMQASALPLEQFSFKQSTGFLVNGTLLSTTGNNNIGWYESADGLAPPAGEFDTIAWGTPITNSGGGLLGANPIGPGSGNPATDFSGLKVVGYSDVTSPTPGAFMTGADLGGGLSDWGAWKTISTVYHQNRAIDATASTLVSAIIRSVLVFDHVPEGDIGSDVNSVGISFTETFNQLPCTLGNPNGSVCDDLFKFSLGTFAPVHFTLNGHKYEVAFQLANFVGSSTDFPGCPGGVCTIWTAENVTSSLDVQARIREIPEPAMLGLLGLGLLGLSLVKRRKLNA